MPALPRDELLIALGKTMIRHLRDVNGTTQESHLRNRQMANDIEALLKRMDGQADSSAITRG